MAGLTGFTRNTINLTGEIQAHEAEAGGALVPGELAVLGSNGKLTRYNTSGGLTETLIVIENGYIGKTVDDAYADGDKVFYAIPKPGDVYLVRLATGETVAPGTKVIAGTTGRFIATTGTPSKTFGTAIEDYANASGVSQLVKVRF